MTQSAALTPAPSGTVDAILMASGFSRRFTPQNKLLLTYNGVPLARRALELACSVPLFNHVYFVCADSTVAALAEGLPATVVHNDHPELGSRNSVRLGVEASSADHYMFFPCDQPLLNEATILAVLENRAEETIVHPVYRQSPGSPVVFSNAYRDQLLALQPGQHARDIKARHFDKVVSVVLDSCWPLYDIDTPNDFEQLLLACPQTE